MQHDDDPGGGSVFLGLAVVTCIGTLIASVIAAGAQEYAVEAEVLINPLRASFFASFIIGLFAQITE